ncbi:MAG: cysteine desulfurase-like protein [Bacillota bacterium]
MNYDIEYIRSQFPALKLKVNGYPAAYFDGPGGTQVPQRVIDAMFDYLVYCNANAGGKFLTSVNSDRVIKEARQALADFLGAAPEEIAFGQNMTTLNYQLAFALARNPGKRNEILITEIDHEANRGPWLDLAERGFVIRDVKMDIETCTVDMNDFRDKISEKTLVAAFNYASNGVGTISDVKEMIRLAKTAGAYSVVDAVHYALHGPIDVKELDADFLLCSAYKFFGPHVGVFYGKKESFSSLPTYRLRTQSESIPKCIETGTLNHEGLAGAAEAVEFIAELGEKFGNLNQVPRQRWDNKTLSERRRHILAGTQVMEAYEKPLAEKILKQLSVLERVKIYGPPPGVPRTSTISFTIDGISPEQIASKFGEKGIFVWDGHFYAIRQVERFGLDQKGGLVRVGLSPYNTEEEVDRLLEETGGLASK